MSNPGEWIDFAELCRRVPTKSARTLRRYTAARLISSRQLVRGGRLEYNWRTVERELRVMESQGTHAHAAEVLAAMEAPAADGASVEFCTRMVSTIAAMMGVPAEVMDTLRQRPLTAGELARLRVWPAARGGSDEA